MMILGAPGKLVGVNGSRLRRREDASRACVETTDRWLAPREATGVDERSGRDNAGSPSREVPAVIGIGAPRIDQLGCLDGLISLFLERNDGLKHRRPQGHEGSSPSSGTTSHHATPPDNKPSWLGGWLSRP